MPNAGEGPAPAPVCWGVYPGLRTPAPNPEDRLRAAARLLGSALCAAALLAACSGPPGQDAAQAPAATPALLDDRPTGFLRAIAPAWRTDLARHTVPLGEIRPGGPPRDGIPPIDRPVFAPARDAPGYLSEDEPVVVLELDGERRAYPLSILILHEIVNDVVGGVAVAVTYCPLCNTGIAFRRTVDGRTLRMGTTGLLRHSNLIMWDDATESWWQQATGEAIAGELAGRVLDFIPVRIASWSSFRDAFPDGEVLTRDTGFERSYDLPPYGGYDASAELIRELSDGSLSPVERVVSVSWGGSRVAYPFGLLEETPIVHDVVGGRRIVVLYAGGTLSPFAKRPIFEFDLIGSVVASGETVEVDPASIERRSVGSAAAYEPYAAGMELTFEDRGGVITDRETGSSWDILGRAVAGRLAGSRLPAVEHGNHFWFAQRLFFPDTIVRSREDLEGQAAR